MARKINPAARSLRSPALKPRIVTPKKGKGSYSRKRRSRSKEPSA